MVSFTSVLLFLVLSIFQVATPSETISSESACVASDNAPWLVKMNPGSHGRSECLGYIDPTTAFETITEVTSLPATSQSGPFSKSPYTIVFEGEGIPDVVDVSIRYGATNANYIPITTCLAPDVTRMDDLPKNDTCNVGLTDDGYYFIEFELHERLDTLEQLTLSLLVSKVKDDPQQGGLLADVYQFVIVLKQVD